MGTASILPCFAAYRAPVDNLRDRRRYPQRHIVPLSITAMLFSIDQYTRLIDEHAPDRAFIKLPQIRQFPWRVVVLESCAIDGHKFPTDETPPLSPALDPTG